MSGRYVAGGVTLIYVDFFAIFFNYLQSNSRSVDDSIILIRIGMTKELWVTASPMRVGPRCARVGFVR